MAKEVWPRVPERLWPISARTSPASRGNGRERRRRLHSLFRLPAIDIAEPNDIVLAETSSHSDFDEFERRCSAIREPVRRRHRHIERLALHQCPRDAINDGIGISFHDDPMLGTMHVTMNRKNSAGV